MKKKIIILVLGVVICLSGCKSWLDINRSPNNAEKDVITSDYLLSACQYDIVTNHVNSSNAMLVAHHLTKSGEVSGSYTYLSGQILPQNQDSWWSTYYQIITNLNVVYDKAIESNNDMYRGISLTLISLNYQRLVDIFGNVPYSQACKPLEFPQPEYDKDEDIYNDLILKLDEAIEALSRAVASGVKDPVLAKADIMCSGNAETWLKVAYTIQLRILMRMSGVKDVSARINAIKEKCLAPNDIIEANPGYYADNGKMNIMYQVYGWDKNDKEATNRRFYMPTVDLVDILRNNNDPRLRVFVDPRARLGDDPQGESIYSKYELGNEYYIGVPYGQISPSTNNYVSKLGTGLLAGSSDRTNGRLKSSIFITGSEASFFLAEAALKGIISGGDAAAKMYYEQGVIASIVRFEEAMKDDKYSYIGVRPAIIGSAEDAAKAYLAQESTFMNWDKMTTYQQKLNAICSQKWINFIGNNPLEAWFEHRRNDLPLLRASNQGQASKNLSILLYPQTERNLNYENLAKQPEKDVYESLVFWDKENPVVERQELYQ